MDRYELTQPRFKKLVLPNAYLETLAEGFRWTEGPVWFGDRDELLFSDLPNNRCDALERERGPQRLSPDSDFENGHTRDREGRLISCSHRGRRIHRTELDGSITSLSNVRGQEAQLAQRHRREIGRHDLVLRPALRDPDRLRGRKAGGGTARQRLPLRSARRLADRGRRRFPGPNGLCFSPDERRLYIVETGISSQPNPFSTFAYSMCGMTDGWRTDECSAPSRPAMPTASGATRRAISGRVQAMECIASIRAASCSERSSCPRRLRTSPSAGATVAGCSCARRGAFTPSYTNVRGASRP